MKLLQEIYQSFMLLGICPPEQSISHWMTILHIFISVFCACFSLGGLISSTVFCIKHFSIDLESSIYAFSTITSSTMSLYSLIIAHIKRNDIKQMFNDFQTFEKTGKQRIISFKI